MFLRILSRVVLELMVRRHPVRMRVTVVALRGGPATVDDLLPTVYADVDVRMYPCAARSLLAGLQMLQENGHAHEENGRWIHDGES